MSSINFTIYLEYSDNSQASLVAKHLNKLFWNPVIDNNEDMLEGFREIGINETHLRELQELTEGIGAYQYQRSRFHDPEIVRYKRNVVYYEGFYHHHHWFEPFVKCFQCFMNVVDAKKYAFAWNDFDDGQFYAYTDGQGIYCGYADDCSSGPNGFKGLIEWYQQGKLKIIQADESIY